MMNRMFGLLASAACVACATLVTGYSASAPSAAESSLRKLIGESSSRSDTLIGPSHWMRAKSA